MVKCYKNMIKNILDICSFPFLEKWYISRFLNNIYVLVVLSQNQKPLLQFTINWNKKSGQQTKQNNLCQTAISIKMLTYLCYLVRAFAHGAMGRLDWSFMVDPLCYFSFQPVLHDLCNKGCGMCYSVCWMMHIKEPLLLIRNSSPCGGSGFPLLLSEWSITICLMPYNGR